MDPIWLTIAFTFGLAVKLVNLPPLVGYLVAGFVLNALGAESGDFVKTVSDLGVTLLLFTIGLKLKLKNLLKPEIWAGTTIHMGLVTLIYAGFLFLLSYSGLNLFTDFDWYVSLIIAFALSFSSTVFAVKVLEEKGEMDSYHGVLSIGVLIMQDIYAVVFLVFAAGKVPAIYSLGLPVVVILMRPLIFFLFSKVGHGELLVLFGFFLALIAGAELFNFVGLKADLGALVIGISIANHDRAKEMAEALMGFKDFFLIGFFLSIGMSGVPNWETVLIAFILALAVNIKVILYFLVFTRFKVRARTSVFSTLSLANYSEFGLIIAALGVSNNWISPNWLITIALALSITFIISSPLNSYAHTIFVFIKKYLNIFETEERLEYDQAFDIGNAEILIFGMGKLGTAAYDQLYTKYGQKIMGLDYNSDVVKRHTESGRHVVHNDASDSELWTKVKIEKQKKDKQVKIVMLCMNEHKANLFAVERLKAIDFQGMIASTAMHEDEVKQLNEMGVHAAFDLYSEAGSGFADHVCSQLRASV